jgi:hypothetical protein
MTNNRQKTAVDSIIEFCQKQMDNDSSIHKGVYLSIIKFCQEQITEESEIHWKTTLITSKPMEMTNNKQKTAVELMFQEMLEIQQSGKTLTFDENLLLIEKYKEMEKERMIKAYNEDLHGGLSGHRKFNDGEDYYEQTYGENKL